MPPQFQRTKIRIKPKKQPFHLTVEMKRAIAGFTAFLLIVGFIYIAGMKLVESLGGTRLFTFFTSTIGKELISDDQGHTNILLLGVGGLGHDGENLTDSIIIASLDNKNKTVSMLSIPRDYYIKSSLGESRINNLYELGKNKWDADLGLDFVRSTIEKTFDIPLHYVVKVDFSAFKDVVDSVGGIDVMVAETIQDPFYPKDETDGYEPYYITAGQHHLDGAEALKYVRSRKTSSDFDRSKRQQQVLVALKDKAEKQNKLSKASFIKNLYYSLSDHIETTLGIREMISLASFASGWDSSTLNISTINDDPNSKGGFLYTPDRTLFGGAFILMPADMNQLKKYMHSMLYDDISINRIPVSILNGTKIPGMAAVAKMGLGRYGVKVDRFGNGRDQKINDTTWFVNPSWTYSQSQAAVSKNAQASLVTFDATGAVTSVQDDHLKALIDLVTLIIPAPVKQAPDEYKDDPRFYNSALILEVGANGESKVNKLELTYDLIATPESTADTSTTTAISSTNSLSSNSASSVIPLPSDSSNLPLIDVK